MNVSIARRLLCFQSCFLLISMVRVLLYPTLTSFLCLPRVSTFFVSPLHCSQHMLLIYLFRCILCVFTPHGSRSHPCSPFLLFSVLYFADKASKIITFFFLPFFLFNYFPENLLGTLNPFFPFLSLSKHKSFSQLLLVSSPLSIVLCSRSIALLLIDPDV